MLKAHTSVRLSTVKTLKTMKVVEGWNVVNIGLTYVEVSMYNPADLSRFEAIEPSIQVHSSR